MGIGVSGLCADARSLCLFMRKECLVRVVASVVAVVSLNRRRQNHKYVYGEPKETERLVEQIANSERRRRAGGGGRAGGRDWLIAARARAQSRKCTRKSTVDGRTASACWSWATT